jgi:hypothetical protein
MNEESCLPERVDEYLDGGLDRTAAEAFEAHLEACADCRDDLSALLDLRHQAQGLPAAIAPARDLWPEIVARMSATPEGSAHSADAARAGMAFPRSDAAVDMASVTPSGPADVVDIRPGRFTVAPGRWWLAAAAVALVLVSSGTTAYLFRGDVVRQIAPLAVSGESAATAQIGLAAFEPAEEEYRYTVDMLEAELAARRSDLLPETIDAVESNLAIIDRAIAEARQALAADPTSADLPLLLSGIYRRKVELLQTAVSLSARS